MAREDFKRVWKGCRAPELSGRVREFSAEVLSLRDTLANPGGAGTQPALTRMLAVSPVKLGLIDDLPNPEQTFGDPKFGRSKLLHVRIL